ncbi:MULTISPECIES: hypothetical protein [Luteimonas]|uniref:hypothetical protein n=1 Tax=Luteimonas TaxID=83614 RepID=UPI000C7E2875|nr:MULTISPECIES: hypothetical protein [Luteimonas]
MHRPLLLFLLCCLIATRAPLQARDVDSADAGNADNAELATLYREDQDARKVADIDWSIVSREDAGRRERVLTLMRDGALRTAPDHYHAAMVFQHGQGLEDIRIAHALATVASTRVPDEMRYRWLVAASWDRILTTQLQPQWYGTQFKGDAVGFFLFPVAEDAVDDAERARMGVPPLAETQARVAEMAASMGQSVHPDPPTIEQLRQARRASPATP